MIRESNLKKRNQHIEVGLKCAAKHKLAWESLNIFFLRSIIRKVPFCKSKSTIRFWFQSCLCFACATLRTYSTFFNLHKKDSLKWFKSIGQDNFFDLALLLVYKIFEQDNNNNSNGTSNINNNSNNNNNNNNNNTISYFVQTVRKGLMLLCQHHVNNSFDQTFDGLPMSFYITAKCTVNFFHSYSFECTNKLPEAILLCHQCGASHPYQ